MTKTNTIFYDLPSGVVVDRGLLNGLSTTKLNETMASVYALQKQVTFVDSAAMFFSIKNILATLAGDLTPLPLMLEHTKIELPSGYMQRIKDFAEVRAFIEKALVDVVGPYPFHAVPDTFNVNTYFKITATYIERQQSAGYRIGIKTAEQVWKKACVKWKDEAAVNSHSVKADGYSRTVRYHPDSVEIGCQGIPRHAIEQLAVRMNWDFPA